MKKMFVLLIALGFAIGAEAQNYAVRNALNVNTRVRIKSNSLLCVSVCEATVPAGIGQVCPPGSTLIPTCNGSVAKYLGSVQVWSPTLLAYVTLPATIGNCPPFAIGTGAVVPGVGPVTAIWQMAGTTPYIWVHL